MTSQPACATTPLPADLLSVAVGSGGDLQHDQLACGFLTGKVPGEADWSNWAPDDWCKLSMEHPAHEAGDLHRDTNRTQGGLDSKPPNGLDSGPMLVFFAAHGDYKTWYTAGDSERQRQVLLDHVLLGNNAALPENQGLRYLWLCSCQTMAHGKWLDGGAEGWDYSNPATFYFGGNGLDREGVRNVFARWPLHLGPRLRLACGGSSDICGNRKELSERIWDDYNNKDYPVADSFLEGVFNAPSGVPLCLTRGKEDPTTTPLYDRRFTRKANPYIPKRDDPPYIHLLYPVQFGNERRLQDAVPAAPAGDYPVFYFWPEGYEPLCKGGAAPGGNRCPAAQSTTAVHPERLDVRSGARYLGPGPIGPPALLVGAPQQWEEGRFINLAVELLAQQGWTERHHRSPEGVHLVIETALESAFGDNFKRQQKAVLVRFKRQIPIQRDPVRTELVNVLGPGGEISILFNNDGSVITASKVWRPVIDDNRSLNRVARVAPREAKTSQKALDDLRSRADWRVAAESYQRDPATYVWGYKEEAGNCRQRILRLVYQFTFLPKDDDRFQRLPPLTLEVPAQILPEDGATGPAAPCYPEPGV